MTSPPPERTLHITAGLPIPPRLESDFAQLDKLPAAALDQLWEVLGPSLREPPPPGLDKQLASFTQRYRLDPHTLGDAMRAGRMLFREAARWRLTREQVGHDLATLGASEAVTAALLAGYDAAIQQQHQEITYRTLADHGRLLADVTWRIDQLKSSTRGEDIGEPVASITLSYMEGSEVRRLTLQALPREVEKLQAICARILAG